MLFRAIGLLEVSDSARTLTPSADKPRRLLLLLLLRANRWVPDSELVDVVWPDGAPASAAGNVKSYVSQLRAVLGPVDGRGTRIDRQPGAYRLNAGRDEIDSMIFEDLVELGRGALDPGHANGDTGHFWRAADAVSGRVEARVRIPRGCDCHRPGFTLWSETGRQQAGEIVFLQAPGGDRQTARFAVHHPGRDSIAETRRIDLTVWNTVAVEWSPGHVSGFLNGERWFHTDRAQDVPAGGLRPTFKMDWLGGTEPARSTVEIDWIKVYDALV